MAVPWGKLLTLLERVAGALEKANLTAGTPAPAASVETELPNLDLPLDLYPMFDWSSIGAEVITRDAHGASLIRWPAQGGHIFKRRSPTNKFGDVIIFSRATGTGADGKTQYARLARFRRQATPDPLPAQVASAFHGNGHDKVQA